MSEVYPFAAGVWGQQEEREDGVGLIVWSRHRTEAAARRAAIGYARRKGPSAGGALSWAGGHRGPDGATRWLRADGTEIATY